jgi:hypothetical protein
MITILGLHSSTQRIASKPFTASHVSMGLNRVASNAFTLLLARRWSSTMSIRKVLGMMIFYLADRQ